MIAAFDTKSFLRAFQLILVNRERESFSLAT